MRVQQMGMTSVSNRRVKGARPASTNKTTCAKRVQERVHGGRHEWVVSGIHTSLLWCCLYLQGQLRRGRKGAMQGPKT